MKGATIWTSGPAGTIENGDMLIEKGKIVKVGKSLSVPSGAIVIDGKGKHVTAGIIDCHSHIRRGGGVNETGQAITAEVRIGDFIDPDDINIYRQLAGGVTAANILHGSANPIGGQNQVIKLRWGIARRRDEVRGRPPGIKFALGENVKQSNWGDDITTRYPQTRMGVEQIIRDAFTAAHGLSSRNARLPLGKESARLPAAARPRAGGPGRDPRRQAAGPLPLATGRTRSSCSDARRRRLRLQDRHASSTCSRATRSPTRSRSTARAARRFTDWWAYKFEVYDAIPYNGALMHDAGVVVSFNSDADELARRLNLEAAKAVKYGGVPPDEALKFVTLNPGEAAADRQARRLARAGQGRRLRRLERRPALDVLALRADLDRRPEVLRPAGGQGIARGSRGTVGPHPEGAESPKASSDDKNDRPGRWLEYEDESEQFMADERAAGRTLTGADLTVDTRSAH